MKRPHSWGVDWHAGIAHSGDGQCPSCNWQGDPVDIQKMMPFMVGYDASATSKMHCAGVFIFECPACFEKFWFHAPKPSVDLLATFNDAWPK